MKRKRTLTAAELRALGANPERVRRVIPPDGRQRAEAGEAPVRFRSALRKTPGAH